MISRRRHLQMARKWQQAAAIGRKMISFRSMSVKRNSGLQNEGPAVRNGHFAVYTSDSRRFVIPLSFLGNRVIQELFSVSEEEFGIPGDGPIVLPIDATSMEYVISLIRRGLGLDQEALLVSFTRCSSHFTADKAPVACLPIHVADKF
ncbi:hypothetical protein MLD38_024542 [Melastoma candidum]|uniref:Uncharacterized protein n=1 Tax=Melastoma candidum TaxID=119954 RepID=A0ACB9NW16_9MYRT|nr:hypothetical protein MLD38_024542 [Melastoma candidum]